MNGMGVVNMFDIQIFSEGNKKRKLILKCYSANLWANSGTVYEITQNFLLTISQFFYLFGICEAFEGPMNTKNFLYINPPIANSYQAFCVERSANDLRVF